MMQHNSHEKSAQELLFILFPNFDSLGGLDFRMLFFMYHLLKFGVNVRQLMVNLKLSRLRCFCVNVFFLVFDLEAQPSTVSARVEILLTLKFCMRIQFTYVNAVIKSYVGKQQVVCTEASRGVYLLVR